METNIRDLPRVASLPCTLANNHDKSLLEFVNDVDGIAFVLGHEISHFVLGHLSASGDVEYVLKTSEIILLSLDPTAGLVTFADVFLVDLLRRSIATA